MISTLLNHLLGSSRRFLIELRFLEPLGGEHQRVEVVLLAVALKDRERFLEALICARLAVTSTSEHNQQSGQDQNTHRRPSHSDECLDNRRKDVATNVRLAAMARPLTALFVCLAFGLPSDVSVAHFALSLTQRLRYQPSNWWSDRTLQVMG